MSELFETEQTLSPLMEWARAQGVEFHNMPTDEFGPEVYKATRGLVHAYGATSTEAREKLEQKLEGFPNFKPFLAWRLEQERGQA